MTFFSPFPPALREAVPSGGGGRLVGLFRKATASAVFFSFSVASLENSHFLISTRAASSLFPFSMRRSETGSLSFPRGLVRLLSCLTSHLPSIRPQCRTGRGLTLFFPRPRPLSEASSRKGHPWLFFFFSMTWALFFFFLPPTGYFNGLPSTETGAWFPPSGPRCPFFQLMRDVGPSPSSSSEEKSLLPRPFLFGGAAAAPLREWERPLFTKRSLPPGSKWLPFFFPRSTLGW